MEQNQSFSVESMLKCCDVKRGGGGGKKRHNDVNFSTRTLNKPPKCHVAILIFLQAHSNQSGTGIITVDNSSLSIPY